MRIAEIFKKNKLIIILNLLMVVGFVLLFRWEKNTFSRILNFLMIFAIPGLWIGLGHYEYEKTKSRSLRTSLPGLFTSLGLLGTFISLCVALSGLSPQDAGFDIMALVQKLVPAFTTSILGLIGAFAVTIWTKINFAKEDAEQATQLNKSAEEHIQDTANGVETLVNSVSQLVQSVKCGQAETKEYNQKLNENLVKQTAALEQFIDGFVNRMDALFERMNSSIETQIKTFGEAQFSQTSEVLTALTKKLTDLSVDLLKKQQETISTMMGDTNTQMGAISTAVTNSLESLTQKIQNSLDKLQTEQSGQLQGLVQSYNASAQQLTDSNDAVNKKLLEQQQKNNEQIIAKVTDVQTFYKEAMENLVASSIDGNEKVVTELQNSLSSTVGSVQKTISEQCNALGAAIATNVESLETAYKSITDFIADIKMNYDQSANTYAEALTNATEANRSTEKTIAAANDSLQAVAQTNKKVGEILDLLNERQENIAQLTKQVNLVGAAIIQLQKLEMMLNKIVNQ